MLLSGPDRRWGVNYEHRLLLDAIRRRDPVDAEHFPCGRSWRTRLALAQHPEVTI